MAVNGVTNTPDVASALSSLSSTYAALNADGQDRLQAARDVAYAPLRAQIAAGGSRVLVLGHSVVAGSGSTAGGSLSMFPLIKQGILSVDQTATVTQNGNPGYTSTQLRAITDAVPDGSLASAESLTIFMGMLNDHSTGIAPSTTQANIAAIVAKRKSAQPSGAPTPGFLILMEWPRADGGPYTYAWSEYLAAARAVAAADPTVTVLDFSQRLGDPSTDPLNVFAADKVHPDDRGHSVIARTVIADIIPGNMSGEVENVFIPVGAMTPITQTNWSGTIGGFTTQYGPYTRESTGAQDALVTYSFRARAGTYKPSLFHRAGSNRGQYQVLVDGVLQSASQDGYAGSPTDILSIMSGTAILIGDGVHTITLKMATKNASSSAYVGAVSALFLTRTGA